MYTVWSTACDATPAMRLRVVMTRCISDILRICFELSVLRPDLKKAKGWQGPRQNDCQTGIGLLNLGLVAIKIAQRWMLRDFS